MTLLLLLFGIFLSPGLWFTYESRTTCNVIKDQGENCFPWVPEGEEYTIIFHEKTQPGSACGTMGEEDLEKQLAQ